MDICHTAYQNYPSVSFRDPGGRLLNMKGRIIRVVHKSALPDLNAYLGSNAVRDFTAAGRLVNTTVLDPIGLNGAAEIINSAKNLDTDDVGMILEHEKIRFPSFPYEWPPEMLYRAGQLTIELAERVLVDGLGLKDATPYNILFSGPKPVFIDVLSFERRDSRDPTWLPYGQFIRTFLLPLLINRFFNVSLQQIFTSRRDGIEPEEVYRLCGLFRKLRPPFLTLVTIPCLLAAKNWKGESNIYQTNASNSSEKARFILERVLTHLRKVLQKVEPKSRITSAWSNYMSSDNSYSEDAFKAKGAFVEQTIREFRPKMVLDVGCNHGHFSTIAAQNGSTVVAIDSDARVVSDVYNNAREKNLNILPLVVDLTRASPAIGWRNSEWPAFLDRAIGSFDMVFMLAVIHHMLVTERIPLSEILNLAADLTTDLLVIEFIAPADPMFQHLTRGRSALHQDLTREVFESVCTQYFDIIRSQQLDSNSRRLYLMRKKRCYDNA